MIFLLSIIGGLVGAFYCGVWRIKYLVKKTDNLISLYFKDKTLSTLEKYTGPLVATAGARIFIMRPLRYWQISKILQLLLVIDTTIELDKLIEQDEFYPALAYCLTNTEESVMALAKYLKQTIGYRQIIRIIQIIILQNDIDMFKQIYKELVA